MKSFGVVVINVLSNLSSYISKVNKAFLSETLVVSPSSTVWEKKFCFRAINAERVSKSSLQNVVKLQSERRIHPEFMEQYSKVLMYKTITAQG